VTTETKSLEIDAGAAARVRGGHPWVFANEVRSPLKDFEPGEIVRIVEPGGRLLGSGYVNPRVLIAVRLLSRGEVMPDRDFVRSRIRDAVAYRERILDDARFGRMVFSESDGLPGIIVDRYGDTFAVQTSTAGASKLEPIVAEVLQSDFGARGVVAANDSPFRELEGLPLGRSVLAGEVPDRVAIEELGLVLEIDPLGGQKTGHYYDQHENRRRFVKLLGSGGRVLDLFCYSGSWALLAARAGGRAIGRDSSERAVAAAVRNAELNALADRCTFERRDLLAPDGEPGEGEHRLFDAVVLDPPPLARNRRAAPAAVRTMMRLVRDAVEKVRVGGLLVACSCSHHMSAADLTQAAAIGAAKARRRLRIITRGGQAPDHPLLPAAPETEYLHALFLEVR
jgi:23S rRNA (cytosine1962-C5)-methyltransferase